MLLAGLGVAGLFHMAARGIWPEALPEGIGDHSGKPAVPRSSLTPSQWRQFAHDHKFMLAVITVLTASPGSLQNFNIPSDYVQTGSSVETIAGGGSGAASGSGGSSAKQSGGGGGAYSKVTGLALTPGGTAQYQIGVGGIAASTTGDQNGNSGGDSWFNGASLAASSVGAKAGLGGVFGSTSANGGAGGSAASGVGSLLKNGGRGGNLTAGSFSSSGGGGAGGPNGDGNNGVDISTSSTASAGGSGDAGFGGTGSAGNVVASGSSTAQNGNAGTELLGGVGPGGGGGAAISQAGGSAQAGKGGNYGAGGGGAFSFASTGISGAGAQGVIIFFYVLPPPIIGSAVPQAVLITLIPPPPDPFMGQQGQLSARRLVPPISGPAPQNPPFPGAYALSQPTAVAVNWIPPPPGPYMGAVNAQPYGPDWKSPPNTPTPLITQGLGRTQAPWSTFQAWDAVTWSATNYSLPHGNEQFWQQELLDPPISGPPPQRPPVTGPRTGIPPAIIDAWIPPEPRFQTVRNLVPPISGPISGNNGSLFVLFNSIVAGQNLTWCDFDLYTITLFNGQTIRLTTADFDINVNGNVFSSQGVRIDQAQSKSQAHWKIGFDVDTWTVVLMPRPIDIATGTVFPDVIGNIPWIQAAHSGYLDAADFQVDRAFFSTMPTWPMTPGGAVPTATRTIFAGKIQAVDCTDLVVVLTVNDYRDLLSINIPLHFYSAQCRHTLFDAGCNADGTMTIGRFTKAGTVGAGSTRWNIIPSGGMPSPGGSGTYALGTITMTSGNNNTFSRTIITWDGTNMKLVQPFPFDVSPGDTFNASAGCDLQRTTCTLFGNLINFGGQPYIPAPEVTS